MEREAEQQREMEVGHFLRSRRLRAGLSISEASNVLCIREAYLKAIEEGRFGDLPGPTYVAGFIRTYAEHLGLDGNEVVRQLKAEPLSMDSGSELRFPSPMSEGGMPSGAILLLGVFVGLIAYGVWYVSSTRDESIAELISPLPERLVAFLRDGSGGADGDETAQRPIAPESSKRQRAASDAGSVPTNQASRPVSAASEPRASDDQESTVSRGLSSRGVSESGSTDRSSSSVTTPSVRDLMGGADAETAARETTRIDDAAEDAEPRTSIVTPLGSADADGQAARQDAPDPEQPPPADTAEALDARIVLRAKGENWVEIREQNTDRLVVARLFQPGDTFDVPNTPGLKLLTGNAGGLEILVDGEPVPPLGVEGMVRRNIPLDADRLRSGALAR